MRPPIGTAACLAVAVAIMACGERAPKPVPMDPITGDEAAALARRFEAATEPCDPVQIDALVDLDQIMRAALAGTHLRPTEKRDALAGLERSTSVGRQLCGHATSALTVDLLRVREVDGHPRPLLRFVADGGLNYYELHGARSKRDGAVRIVDMYIYLSGEPLTETMATSMDQARGQARRGALPDIEPITAAMRRGDHAEARRLIAALPAALRDGKGLRLMDIQAAAALAAPDHLDVIDRYARAFPGDPSTDFVSIDAYFLRKQVAPLLAAVDRLDRRVGGDPYLDLMRANGLMLEPTPAHLAEADRHARAVTEALPHLINPWWTRATIQLLRGDFAGVVPTLDELTTRFGVTFDRDAMAADPQWQGFLASPEFTAWWARQHAR